MTDMRKSVLLRAILFVAFSICFWIATGVVDYLWDRMWHNLFDRRYSNVVENSIFIYVTSAILWRWLSRRVWIGSLPGSHPSQRGER
jgi:hypothetical protein